MLRRLIRNEARLLRRLNRVDEAVALYDEQIEAARHAGLTDHARWLLDWKLQLVVQSRRFDDAITVAEACRQAAEHGSDAWLTATYIKSVALRKTGQFREALRMSTEQFATSPQPYTMLDLAECCFGGGDAAEGNAWLAKADAEVKRLQESARPGDRSMATKVSERLSSIRERRAQD